MHALTIENWKLSVHEGPLPGVYSSYIDHAVFVDKIDSDSTEGIPLFVAVSSASSNWPNLISTQRYSPTGGLSVGCLLIPEKALLFIGAGEKILCYDVAASKRLWIDATPRGFWRWLHVGEYVVMSAELEFAVWNSSGEKLWSTFVKPPWTFTIMGDVVEFDIIGGKQNRMLADGKIIKI